MHKVKYQLFPKKRELWKYFDSLQIKSEILFPDMLLLIPMK